MVQPDSLTDYPAEKNPLQIRISDVENPGGTAERVILQLSDHQGIWYVKISDITFLEADGNYSTVHVTTGDSRVVCRPLGEFDTRLSSCGFLRVHQSYLINLSQVQAYLREHGGTIILVGGGRVYLSRSHRLAFFAAMNDRSCW